MSLFNSFDPGHADLVTVTKFNFYGNRLLTASADHRIKVWDLQKDGSWTLIDAWRGHDAEIRDAKWNAPFTGQHLASVSEDMKFKLWAEDSTSPPLSGRRFREIYKLVSPVRTPYVSLDFKNLDLDTWLALITRDGLLTVLEPVAPDNLSEWNQVDQWRVCPIPPRGEETSFKLSFHHDPLDATHTISDGAVPKKTLSLVVAVNDTVKIYRTGAFDQRFYHAIELPGHGGLVRDVAWANGSVRGFDLIATACKDGYVRVFEVYTTFVNLNHANTATNNGTNSSSKEKEKTVLALSSAADSHSASNSRPTSSSGTGIAHLTRDPPNTTTTATPSHRTSHAASGIGSALAGVHHHHTASQVGSRDAAGLNTSSTIGNAGGGFEFRHTAHEVGGLVSRHRDVWEVEFSYAGDCLASTGDDGTIRLWKRSLSGAWLEFAETNMEAE